MNILLLFLIFNSIFNAFIEEISKIIVSLKVHSDILFISTYTHYILYLLRIIYFLYLSRFILVYFICLYFEAINTYLL